MPRYQVIVGNIGTVEDTDDQEQARRAFNTYKAYIQNGETRAEEFVSLIDGSEILEDWHDPLADTGDLDDEEDGIEDEAPNYIYAKFVKVIQVIDPDTGNEVELEIWKSPSSDSIFGVESSWLDQSAPEYRDPYTNAMLYLPSEDVHEAINARNRKQSTDRRQHQRIRIRLPDGDFNEPAETTPGVPRSG